MKAKPKKIKAIWITVFGLLAIMLFAKACQKDKFELPVVHTGEVVEITPDGVIFHGKIIEQGNREITDHGFVWSTQKSPTLENSYVKSKGGLKEAVFQAQIMSGFEEGKPYFLKAYVRVNETTIYGREVSFRSLGSQGHLITGFEPLQATWGDTLNIYGKNFSLKPGENIVKIQNTLCQVIFETDTIIRIIVSENLLNSKSTVSVSFLGNIASAVQLFQITPPEVHDFSPKQGTYNTPVVITGMFFKPNATQVFFGEKQAQVTEMSGNEIKALAPQGVSPGENLIKVRVIDQDAYASQPFNFKIPVVVEVTPPSGTWMQNITIKGSNFSENLSENVVKFNTTAATIVHASNDSLVVKVPENLLKKISQVTVAVFGETSQDVVYFNLLDPVINSITPPNGTFRDIIEIHGEFFNPVAQNNQVLFNNTPAVVLNSTNNLIRVRVPENITNYQNTIKVLIGDMQAISNEPFELNLHTINSFTPTSGVLGNTIVISGSGFNPIKENNTVLINNQPAEIISASLNSITVGIPETTPHGEHFIVVNILGRDVQTQQPFMLYQPWTRLNDPPFGPRSGMFTFKIGNRIFVGGGRSPQGIMLDFWEYYSLNDTWVQRAPIPGPWIPQASFSTASKGYIVPTYNTNAVYAYNPELDQWTVAGNHPTNIWYPSSFSVNNIGYVVGGVTRNTTFRFNENDLSWSARANLPFFELSSGIGFGIGDKGYVALGRISQHDPAIFSFNPTLNSWQAEVNLIGQIPHIERGRCSPTAFVIEGKAYFGSGRNCYTISDDQGTMLPDIFFNDIFKYSPGTNDLQFIGNLPAQGRISAFSFSDQGFGFLGGGYYVTPSWPENQTIRLGDFYKFDPTTLPPWLK